MVTENSIDLKESATSKNFLAPTVGYRVACITDKKTATERRVFSFWKQGKLSATTMALLSILGELGCATGEMLEAAMQFAPIPTTLKKSSSVSGRNPYRKEFEFLTGEGIVEKLRVVDRYDLFHSPNIYMLAKGAVPVVKQYIRTKTPLCGKPVGANYYGNSYADLPANYGQILERLAVNRFYLGIYGDYMLGRLQGIEYAYPGYVPNRLYNMPCASIGLNQRNTEFVIGAARSEVNAKEQLLNFLSATGINRLGVKNYRRVPVIICPSMNDVGELWSYFCRNGANEPGGILFFTDDTVQEHRMSGSGLLLNKGYAFADTTLDKMIMSLDLGFII